MPIPFETSRCRFDRIPRVLIADDHLLFAMALRHALTDWNFEVLEPASNGAEAVERASRLRPDVVLMDVHMPILDGVEATRRIRASLPHVTVVAITSDDTPGLADELHAAGASRVLLKTCPPHELLDAVLHAAAEVVPFRYQGAA